MMTKASEIKLKYLVNLQTEHAEDNNGYIGLENVESWSGRKKTTNTPTAEGVALSCQKGDVLFGKLRPYLAKCYVAEEDACCSTEFFVMRPEKVISKYLQYRILSPDFIDKVNMSTYGAKMPRASWTFVGNMKLRAPSIGEQQSIANYLDDRCGKIDDLIAEAKASIEEYQQLKQSIIYEAVTKGLDKNAKMKDSGVDWIDEIPFNWHIVKITRILDKNHPYAIGDGDHGSIKTDQYRDSGIPFIRVQNLGWGTELNLENIVYISEDDNRQIQNSTLHPNDILFAKTGATIGKTAIVPESMPIANTTSHVGKITIAEEHNPRYVFYVLSSQVGYRQFWNIAIQKTTRPELSIEETKSIKIILPPDRETEDVIVRYLDEKVPALESMISEKQSLISDFEAYKKSLIYEVVTGKRKVVAS